MPSAQDDALIAALQASGAAIAVWDISRDEVRWLTMPHGLLPGIPVPARFEDLLPHIHPDDRAAFQDRVTALLDAGEEYVAETRILALDGSVRWLAERARLVRGPAGKPESLTIVAIDISEARQAEQQLAATRRRFRAIHDLSPDAVVLAVPVHDGAGGIADFRYTYLNPRALTMAQRSEGEMLGRAILEFFPENQAYGLHDFYVRAFTGGTPEVQEIRYEGGGISGWFRTTAVRVGDELAITVADITDRKEGEERLRQALDQRMTLLREMNHRVKNSLQMVASLVQLHRMRTRDPQAREVFDAATARVRAVAEVHRLLYQGDRIGDVDLRELLRTVAENFDASAGSRVQPTMPEHPVMVPVDQAIPVGLIANELITNAAKHAYQGGQGPIRVLLERTTGGPIRLTVEDDGRGIPPGTDWQSASTLGMMLLRSLSDQLDGELQLDSGFWGTRITVTWDP